MKHIYNHRIEKIQFMNDFVLKIQESTEHHENLINESIHFEKKALLKHLIYKIDEESKDVFNLAVKLKTMGVNQFFEVLKTELNKVDDVQGFLDSFDFDDNRIEAESLKKRIEDMKLSMSNEMKSYENYPLELSLLFNIIFKDDLINDQDKVMQYKEMKPLFLIASRKKKAVQDAIKKYYDIYLNHNTLTNGFDLFNEYSKYDVLIKKIDSKNNDIYKLKRQLKSVEAEKHLFEKELQDMKLFNNFDKVKKRVIDKFISFSSNVENLDYYIEKIAIYKEDKTSLKTLYVLQLKQNYLQEMMRYITPIDKGLYEDVKKVEHVFRYMIFCKHELIDFPYFSNVGYFEARMRSYEESKYAFFKMFFTNKFIISDDFQLFSENFKKNVTNKMLKDILRLNSDFCIFEEREINKLKKEKDFILDKFNKHY